MTTRIYILLISLISTSAFGQIDTIFQGYCTNCELPQYLFELNGLPGADLISLSGDSVFFNMNNGNGQFLPPQFFSTVPDSSEVEVFEDIDDDGDMDLVVRTDSSVFLCRNEGNSYAWVDLDTTLSSLNWWEFQPIAQGRIRSMYVDNDTLKDLVWRSQSPSDWRWYRNDGNGSYVKETYVFPINVGMPKEFAMYDHNNDGFMDVVEGTIQELRFHEWNGNSWDSIPVVYSVNLNWAWPEGALEIVDLNLDGVMDVLSNSIWYLSDTDNAGQFKVIKGGTFGGQNWGQYRRVVDLDCDGELEVFAQGANAGNASFVYHHLVADTVWTDGTGLFTPFFCCVRHAIADINGDGAPDLLYEPINSGLGLPSGDVFVRYNTATTPVVNFLPSTTVFGYGQNIQLDGGFPQGGTYSGPGVVGDSLFSTLTPGGPVTVTYTYEGFMGCVDSASFVFDIVTGLSEEQEAGWIQISPNPVDQVLSIENGHREELRIEIRDATGKLVLSEGSLAPGGRTKVLTDQLGAGLYFLSASDASERIVQLEKLMVE